MEGYDVSKDGKIDETEFMDSFGKILPGCMEEHCPPELLAEMANNQGCGDEHYEEETYVFSNPELERICSNSNLFSI